jgi:type III pantothenate kinase
MILTFDVGNTETVLGLFDGEALLDHWRYSTHPERTVDELGLLVRALVRESGFRLDQLHAAVIGSVVPPVTSELAVMCARHLGVDVLLVDARTDLPIRLIVDEPLTVGADRIANTLAASSLYRRDTIAVDLGTATTFDCITADGDFVGGIISPGIRTGAETLVRRTAQLPRVDLDPPETVIGRRTAASLRSEPGWGSGSHPARRIPAPPAPARPAPGWAAPRGAPPASPGGSRDPGRPSPSCPRPCPA